jgi:shikimate dehydrogenase
VLHRRAYDELGLDWDYRALDVTADQLPVFLDSLDAAWVGLSLTMPLKEVVLPLLHEVEPLAAATASVNTVLLSDGRRRGHNTDVIGLRGILREGGAVSGCRALVVGAGATARSAVAALVAEGAGSVAVSARRSDAVEDLRGRLSALPDLLGHEGPTVGAEPWPPQVDTWDVVISTVPAHALDEVAASTIKPSSLLVDVLYDPWPTPLAVGWERAGGDVVGGLELLVRQAVEQVALMTGRRPTAALMRAAGESVLRTRRFAQEEQ